MFSTLAPLTSASQLSTKLRSYGVQHEDNRSQPGLIDTYIKSCQLTSLSSELQFSPTLHYHRHLQATKSD